MCLWEVVSVWWLQRKEALEDCGGLQRGEEMEGTGKAICIDSVKAGVQKGFASQVKF